MSGYSNAMKDFIERYKVEVGAEGVFDLRAVAEWAYSKGLYKPNPTTVIDAIAKDMAQVLREEYRVDRRRWRSAAPDQSPCGETWTIPTCRTRISGSRSRSAAIRSSAIACSLLPTLPHRSGLMRPVEKRGVSDTLPRTIRTSSVCVLKPVRISLIA